MNAWKFFTECRSLRSSTKILEYQSKLQKMLSQFSSSNKR